MVGVARHQHLGDGRLGWHAALDQAVRGRGLNHHALAGAAGILRPLGDQHAELRREHVEPFRRVGPDLDHRALTARAGGALGQQHLFDARQMCRQPAAAGPAPGGLLPAQLRRALLGLGLVAGERGLGLLEGELQLLLGQPLRARPELHAP